MQITFSETHEKRFVKIRYLENDNLKAVPRELKYLMRLLTIESWTSQRK